MAEEHKESHEGGCVCGAVRYRTTGEPRRVSLCACSWCQKRTGSALGVSVYFRKPDVTFNEGAQDKLGCYRLTSDAGRPIDQEFCTTCGTALTWTLEFLPDFRGLAGGTFDRPTFWYRPQRFVFARSKPDWLHIPEGLEVYQAMPGSAEG